MGLLIAVIPKWLYTAICLSNSPIKNLISR
jgi:hypothetical protein